MHIPNPSYELYNAVTVGVCVVDSDYSIVYWNDAMIQLTGMDRAIVQDQNFLVLFPNFSDPVLLERMNSVFRDGLPVIISSKLHPTFFPSTWPHNADSLHEIKICSIYDPTVNKRMAVFTVEDVTDHTRRLFEQRIIYKRAIEEVRQRRKAEAQLKESELKLRESIATKDKFFSIIAHDLKSPFASLLSYSDYMLTREDSLDAHGAEELLTTVNSIAKSGFGLLENLLTWSRLQTGRLVYTADIFEIKGTIEDLLQSLSFQAREKKVALVYDCEPSYISADINMIRTVFRNLIGNAIKFSFPHSEILISGFQDKNGDFLFSVKDSGVGIPIADLSKIFDITNHYSMQGTNNETGSGLGLILCKEFVELHNGRIWVHSEEHNGTTFSFTIPQGKFRPLNT